MSKSSKVSSIDKTFHIARLNQSGYLTIKGYDPIDRLYRLGFPNEEVERGFLNFLLPYCKLTKKDTRYHSSQTKEPS